MLEHDWDLKSVDFPLTSESVVFEIGGYEGRWAVEIAQRFNPILYVFEPQPWAFDKCREALKGFDGSGVYPFAVGVTTGKFPMGNWETDGCSFSHLPDGKPQGFGYMREIRTVMHEIGEASIDLCLMNVEGYEFELIPYMLENGVMDKVKYFMVQFHIRNEEDQKKYFDIIRRMGEIKKVRFNYGPILMCWEPK